MLFMNGPSSINKKVEPVYIRIHGTATPVIFLDQPLTSAFPTAAVRLATRSPPEKTSYASSPSSSSSFPICEAGLPISGESYAGHYIPVFAAEILGHRSVTSNLKSVLIGNGLTDGLTIRYYKPMACGEGWMACSP